MREDHQTLGTPDPAEALAEKAYRVHLYLSVRLPVDVPHAVSQLEAIGVALRSTDLPTAARAGVYADDVHAAMVDEVGDEDHVRSTTYTPGPTDAQPWVEVAQTDPTESDLDGPTTFRYLNLSARHVSRQTMGWLSERPSAASVGLGVTIAPYEYGAFVSIPSDIGDLIDVESAACPEDLKVVLRFGHSIGCYLLRLDQNGELSGQLPIYGS